MSVIDAVSAPKSRAGLHVDAVTVQKDPLFVMLLAEVASSEDIQPGYDLRRFLRRHAGTYFVRLLFKNFAVGGHFWFGPGFRDHRVRFRQSVSPDSSRPDRSTIRSKHDQKK
jgi:hypothetical protein